MQLTRYYKFYSFLVLSLLFFNPSFLDAQRVKEGVVLNIDFAKKSKEVKSLSGFLHYDNIRQLENDIDQLKPKYWRIGWSYKSVSDVDFLRSKGITPILVLSDLYAYPGKKNNKDWQNPLKGDKLKRLIETEYAKLKNNVIYDIWNEPFHQEVSGDFDEEEYYQIFKKAYDIIRSQPGGDKAIITGPSFDRYDEKEIENFLKFCDKNKMKIEVFSWHEWRERHYLNEFTKDITKFRKEILPKYPNVGVKKIVLGEIINQYSQFSASEILEILRVLELNDVDGSCKGCWQGSDGVSTCNNSINGLLTNNHQPRAAWWAYKLYSQSTTNRVKYTTNYSEVWAFPSYDTNGNYILVNNNSGNRVVDSKINISNLPAIKGSSSKVNITIYEIPDSGEKALPQMKLIKNMKISSKSKSCKLTIDNMTPKSLYYITFAK